MKQYADTLARSYDLGDTPEDFYNYIVESLINGNRKQVRYLFNEMNNASKQDFLIDYLDVSDLMHKSVLNICIGELF